MTKHRFALFALLISLFATPARPENPTTGSLEYLKGFVGQYPPDVKLWETEPLKGRLAALLGDRYGTFVANMEVNNPLASYGDVVWASGVKPHDGVANAALFLADTKADVIEVYLVSDGTLHHVADPGAMIPLEGDAQKVLAMFEGTAKGE